MQNIIKLSVLLVLILLGSAIYHYAFDQSEFYNVRLVEVVRIVVLLFMAGFISYAVHDRLNINNKRKEIIAELITDFQAKITEIFKLSDDYFEQPDVNRQRKIMVNFTTANSLLNILTEENEELIKTMDIRRFNITNNYLQFKRVVTDSPFASKSPTYSINEKIKLMKYYGHLIKKLQKIKIQIYFSRNQ